MLILVPREKIFELLPFGLVAGVFLAAGIQVLAVHVLRLWEFNFLMPPVDLFGLPTFLILAWGVGEIIFAHLLPKKSYLRAFLFILAFSFGSTLVEWFFHKKNLIVLLRWHEVLTFFLAVGLHVVLGYYLIQKDKLKKTVYIRRKL
jgi:hypothetical protein